MGLFKDLELKKAIVAKLDAYCTYHGLQVTKAVVVDHKETDGSYIYEFYVEGSSFKIICFKHNNSVIAID